MGWRSAVRAVQEDVAQSGTGRTKSSVPDRFVQVVFVPLSQKAAVSMQMRSTDSEGYLER